MKSTRRFLSVTVIGYDGDHVKTVGTRIFKPFEIVLPVKDIVLAEEFTGDIEFFKGAKSTIWINRRGTDVHYIVKETLDVIKKKLDI